MKDNDRMMRHIICCLLILIPSLVSAESYSNEDQSNDQALFEQAVLMSSDGDWPNAEKIFRDVALRNPGWPEPKNNLAIALYNMGKLEQARQALDEAVTSLPSFKVAQANRQRLYDYAATTAYYNVVGIAEEPELPRLELLTEVQLTPNATRPKSHAQSTIESNPGQPDEIEQQIRKSILDWSKSWSVADVDTYLSVYSTQFKPSDPGKNYEQWRIDRTAKLRFGKIDRVSVKSIAVYLDSNQQQALVQFVQHYQSSKYQDKVIKQLQLALEEGRWLIRSERVLRQLN
jgi:tetratricopeptide (TPR) repeat protein